MISFQIEKKEDSIRLPNTALRFYPARDKVRTEDHKILDGKTDSMEEEESTTQHSAAEQTEASRKSHHRHVWIVEGEMLRAVPVETGLVDSMYSELISGEIKEGDQLVTGEKSKK